MSRIYTPGAQQGTGEGVKSDFNTIEIFDADHQRREQYNMRLAKIIGTALVQKYNNREWKVIADIENGIVIVACDSISNEKGYHIHTAGRTIQQLCEKAVMAAGEILERHELARSKGFNVDHYETLTRDARDNVITPDSVAEPI